jgi:hypothetical protein
LGPPRTAVYPAVRGLLLLRHLYQRLSAVELTQTKLRPSWRNRFYQTLERNRIAGFLRKRAQSLTNYWRGKEALQYA